MTAIVLGWGLALLPLGFDIPLGITLGAFFTGALIWGPWTSLSMAVFQDAAPPEALAQVLAARGSLLIVASPLGTALGGPLVTTLGARGTLRVSALGTVVIGLLAAAMLSRTAWRRRSRSPASLARPVGDAGNRLDQATKRT
jgi:predicted MFS family arabinose efflux permease